MKLSVAPLSISALTLEWRVHEWKVTRVWTEFLFGMNTAWGNNAQSMARCCGLSKNPGQLWSFLWGGFLVDLRIICWSGQPNCEHPLVRILVCILGCYTPWTICTVLYLYSHTMCTTGLFLPDSDCLIGLTRYLDTQQPRCAHVPSLTG